MSKIDDPALIYAIPRHVIFETLTFLRTRGDDACEGVVLWPGILEKDFCRIVECLVPKQMAGRQTYRIPDDEVFRVIEYVASRGLVVPIQVHSHPGEAFHSETDDERAFVQHTNAISIVLPNFARSPNYKFLTDAVVYSLVYGCTWRELSREETGRRFQIGE